MELHWCTVVSGCGWSDSVWYHNSENLSSINYIQEGILPQVEIDYWLQLQPNTLLDKVRGAGAGPMPLKVMVKVAANILILEESSSTMFFTG